MAYSANDVGGAKAAAEDAQKAQNNNNLRAAGISANQHGDGLTHGPIAPHTNDGNGRCSICGRI
jgi:hypothetical protein